MENSLNNPKTGSCFWKHKWSKWKLYEAEMINIRYNNRYMELRQRRVCENCGKTQDEWIR